jgi:hypothetical protein
VTAAVPVKKEFEALLDVTVMMTIREKMRVKTSLFLQQW